MAERQGNPVRRVPASVTEVFRSLQAAATTGDGVGLRERKKAQLRQAISDTATMMFLERGFDAVKVSEIAAACDVSEKTIFNYFPTKESLLFDNSDAVLAAIRESVSDHGDGRSIADAAHATVIAEFERIHTYWRSADEDSVLEVVRRFGDLIEQTPALLAAQHEMLERMVEEAAVALAERAGVDPHDPEPQIAALMVAGLWRVQYASMRRHVRTATTVDELRTAVLAEVERAAMMAESGLSSFDAAIARGRRTGGAASVDEARKHVVAAVRHAREAWRVAKAAHDAEHAGAADHVAAIRDEVERHRNETKRLRRIGDDAAMRAEVQRHRATVRRLKQAMRSDHSGR